MNEYLNVSQVAELLGVCRQTVRRHVIAGHLPVIALSKRTHRFAKRDVLAFLERHRRGQVAADAV